MFSERNTGAVDLGAEAEQYICITSRPSIMIFSGSLCQIVALLGAHMGMGLFLGSAKRRVNQNAVCGAGAKRDSAYHNNEDKYQHFIY